MSSQGPKGSYGTGAATGAALEPNQARSLSGGLDGVPAKVTERLGEAVGVSGKRSRRYGAKLEAPIRGQAQTVPEFLHERGHIDRLGTQKVDPLGLGQD